MTCRLASANQLRLYVRLYGYFGLLLWLVGFGLLLWAGAVIGWVRWGGAWGWAFALFQPLVVPY